VADFFLGGRTFVAKFGRSRTSQIRPNSNFGTELLRISSYEKHALSQYMPVWHHVYSLLSLNFNSFFFMQTLEFLWYAMLSLTSHKTWKNAQLVNDTEHYAVEVFHWLQLIKLPPSDRIGLERN
jgi:hypothetical protein